MPDLKEPHESQENQVRSKRFSRGEDLKLDFLLKGGAGFVRWPVAPGRRLACNQL